MKVGYARVSTAGQEYSLEDQIKKLTDVGCTKIFSESVSSVDDRDEFKKALRFVRECDYLIVTSLSRFARSMSDLLKNVEYLKKKGVEFIILDINIDTQTSTGRLMLNLLGSFYQFEREIMLERQKIGILKAKKAGKFKGKQHLKKGIVDQMFILHRNGMKPKYIAKNLNLGLSTVYRYLSKINSPSNSV